MATAKVWVRKNGEDKGSASMQESIKADEADQFSASNTGRKNEEFKTVTQPSISDAKAGYLNRFATLDSGKELDIDGDEVRDSEPSEAMEELLFNSPRKLRAAAAGVAGLMKALRAKRRGQLKRVRSRFGQDLLPPEVFLLILLYENSCMEY